jgi:hypothetical protein
VSHDRVNILPVQSKWAERTISVLNRDGAAHPLISQVVDSFTQTVRDTRRGPYITPVG